MSDSQQHVVLTVMSALTPPVELRRGEYRRLLRHRYTLGVTLLAVTFITLGYGFRGHHTELALAVNWAGALAALVVAQGVGWWLERRALARGRSLKINLALLVAAMSVVSFAVGWLLSQVIVGAEPPKTLWLFGTLLVHVFAGQMSSLPFARFVLPFCLRDIRRNPMMTASVPVPMPGVILEMASLDRAFVRPGEMWALASHQLSLVFYMTLVVLLVFLNSNAVLGSLPVEMVVPTYLMGVTVGLGVVHSVLLAADWLSRRLRRTFTIACPPLIFAGTASGLCATEGVTFLQSGQFSMAYDRFLFLAIFDYVLIEAVAITAFRLVFPLVLTNLRGVEVANLSDTLGVLAAPEPTTVRAGAAVAAPTAEDAPVNAPVTSRPIAPPLPGMASARPRVAVAGQEFLLRDLIQIEAEGNYVRVHCRKQRHLLPGPFSAAVSQLPPDAGLLVHRSVWVAGWAITGQRRAGRDLYLTLTLLPEVKVALPRQKFVQNWLAERAGQQAPDTTAERGG